MLIWLKGKIEYKNEKTIGLEINNLGYEIFVNDFLLNKIKIDQEQKLYVHLYLRENTLELYGFETKEELDFFRELISISGIGPKSALAILSLVQLKELKKAVSRGDITFLTKVSGIGKKTAERVVLELKEKIKKIKDESIRYESETDGQVLDALVNLGYSVVEARRALRELPEEIKGVEARTKEALKILSR